MSNLLRPLMIVLALLLLAWMPRWVPGVLPLHAADSSAGSEDFSYGLLIRQAFDPMLLFLFFAGGLLGGGLRGFGSGLRYLLGAGPPRLDEQRSGARAALYGAARGLLWGSFITLVIYTVASYVRVFWLDTWQSTGLEGLFWLDERGRMDLIRVGGYLVLVMFLFVLYPSANSLGPLKAGGRTWARWMDGSAMLGHGLLLFVFPLSMCVLRFAEKGVENSAVYCVLPSWDPISAAFVGWCLLFMILICVLTLGSAWGIGRNHRFHLKEYSLRMTILGAGALTCVVVRIAGFNAIGSSGGSGNPRELQDLGGRMLVPMLLTFALLGAQRLSSWQALRATRPGRKLPQAH